MTPGRQITRNTMVTAALAICLTPSLTFAQSSTVIERMLAKENPCRALQVNALGMSVAINRLDDVNVTSFEISVQRDNLIMELLGRLSCSTGSNSMAQGNIQASIRLFASMDLATCTAPSVSVSLTDITGSFGEILQGFQTEMEAAMTRELSQQLVTECKAITTLP